MLRNSYHSKRKLIILSQNGVWWHWSHGEVRFDEEDYVK